ncbi:hypothetical protein OJ252_3302 [Cryptosporidium canis]|uniref:CKK domain-containing protein n=1 Tax=Cryptosporidium canis TaxID=195482 RepID=A0ABQ8P2S7_9CRYT|nr:hypothetical protein OJ252_3302 [Cryptosporidium canis]
MGLSCGPEKGGGCVCCGSSWAGGSNLGEGGSFHAQGRRVHSYYEQCLSEDSDSSSCGGEQEYLPEGQSPDGHSDISDDMEIVIKRNNRNVISLALNWISLSGEHNKRIRKFVADSLDSVDLKNVPHFVILFQYDDHKGIRGLYSYFQEEKEWQCVVAITPNCPRVIHKEMIHTLYKFDTCQKLFKPMSKSRKITDAVDGLSIKNEYLNKSSY